MQLNSAELGERMTSGQAPRMHVHGQGLHHTYGALSD